MGTSVTASSSASAGTSAHHAAPPRPGGSTTEAVSINQLFSKFKTAGRSTSATQAVPSSAAHSSTTASASNADASHGGSSRSGTTSSVKTATLASKPSLANRTKSSPLLATRPNPISSNVSSSPAPWSRAVSQSNSSHSASGSGASGGRAGGPGGPKSIHAPRPIQLPSRLYEQQHSGEVHKAKITLTRTTSSKSVVAATSSNDTALDSASVPAAHSDAAASPLKKATASSSSTPAATPSSGPTAWSHVAARASGVSNDPANETTDRSRPSRTRSRSQSPSNRQWPPPRHADDAHAPPPPAPHHDHHQFEPDRRHESQDARFGAPPPHSHSSHYGGRGHGDHDRDAGARYHDRAARYADDHHGPPHLRYAGDDRPFRGPYHGSQHAHARGPYAHDDTRGPYAHDDARGQYSHDDAHDHDLAHQRHAVASPRRDRAPSPHMPVRSPPNTDALPRGPSPPRAMARAAAHVDELADTDPYAAQVPPALCRGASASRPVDRDPERAQGHGERADVLPPAPAAAPHQARRWEPHHPLRGSARPATWGGGAGAQRQRPPPPRHHEHGAGGDEATGAFVHELEHAGGDRRGPGGGGYRGPRFGAEGRERRDRRDEYPSEAAPPRARSPRRYSPGRARDENRPRRRAVEGEAVEGEPQPSQGQAQRRYEQGGERRGSNRGPREEEGPGQARPRWGRSRSGEEHEAETVRRDAEEPREGTQQQRRAQPPQERERDVGDNISGATYERMSSKAPEQVAPKLESRNSAKSFRDLLEADAKSIEGQADWAAEDDAPDAPRAVDLSKYIKSKVQERQQNKAKSRQKLQHDTQQPVSPSDASTLLKDEADTVSPPRAVGRRTRSQSPNSQVRANRRSVPSPKKSKTPPPSPPRPAADQQNPVRQASPAARPAAPSPGPKSAPNFAKAAASLSRPASRPLSRAHSPARRSPSPPAASTTPVATGGSNPSGQGQTAGIDASRVTLLRRGNPVSEPSAIAALEPQVERTPASISTPASSSAPSAFSPLLRPKPLPTAATGYLSQGATQGQMYSPQQTPAQQQQQQAPPVVKILQREPSATNAPSMSFPSSNAGATSLFSTQQTPSSSAHSAPLGPSIPSALASIAARPTAVSQPQVHQQYPQRSASPPRPAPLTLSNSNLSTGNHYGAATTTAMRQPFDNRQPMSAVRPPPVSQPRSPFSPQQPMSAPGLSATYGSGNSNNWSSSATATAASPSVRPGQITSQPQSQFTTAQQSFSGRFSQQQQQQQQSQFAPQQQMQKPHQQLQQQSQPHFGPTGFGHNRTNQGRPQQHQQQQQQQPQAQLNSYPYQGQQQPPAHPASHPNTFAPQSNTYQQPPATSGPYQQQQAQHHQAPRGQPMGQYGGGNFAISPVSPSSPHQFQQAHQQYQNRTVQRGGSSSNVGMGMGAGGPVQQQQQQQQQYRQPQQMQGYGQNQPSAYAQAPVTGQHQQQQHGQQQQFFQQQPQPPQQQQQQHQQQQRQQPAQPTGPVPGMYPGYPQAGFMQYQPPPPPGSQPQFAPPHSHSGPPPNPGQLGPNPQPPMPQQQQQPPPQQHMMPGVPMGFMPMMPNQPFPPPPHMQFMPHMAMQVPFPLHMHMQMQVPMQPQQPQSGPAQLQFAPPQFQGPMPPNMQQPPMMFMAPPGLQVPPHYAPGPMTTPPNMVPPTSTSPVTNPVYQANRPPGAPSPTGAGPSAPSPSQPPSSARGAGPPIAGNSVSIDTLDSVLERIKSTLAKPAEEANSATAASPTISPNTQHQPAPSATTPTTTTRDFALDLGPAIVSPSMATKEIKDPDSMVPRRQSVASNMAPGSAVQSRRPSAILSSVPNSTAASPTLGPIADQPQDDAESGGASGGTPGSNLWASPSLRTLTVDAQETVHNSVKHLLRDSDDGEEAVPGVDIKVGMADLGDDAGASSTSLADKGRPGAAADDARRERRGNGRERDAGPQRTGDQAGRRDRQPSGENGGRTRGEHVRNRDTHGRGASSGRRDDGGRGDARSRGPGRQSGVDQGATTGSNRSQRSSTGRGGRGRSQATEGANA